MPAPQQSAPKWKVEFDGTELPEDLDNRLLMAEVESNVHQPDFFRLGFRDEDRALIPISGVKLGSKVKVTLYSEAAPGGQQLFTSGECTGFAVSYDSLGTMTWITGYDQSHRLFRGRYTESYQNMTAADIARKVATRASLQPGQIDPTNPVFPYVAQNNSDDWSFLKKLAGDVGYEVLVDEGKLHFRKPVASAGGPSAGALDDPDDPLKLTMGAHVLRLRSVVTSAGQAGQFEVRSWDPSQKKSLVGAAPAATTSAAIGTTPGDVASPFGNAKVSGLGRPYASQPEVDAAAKALAEQVGGAFAELEGVARGNGALKAGVAVSLSLAGAPFDGKYTLTSARHRFTPEEGYTTAFTVSGRNQRSLLGLASGGSTAVALGATHHEPRVSGVVPAIVTDVNDPQQLGRVKLAFPWLADDFATDWAYMVQIGAGADRGASFLPEVNDLVLVAFEFGDLSRPYVLGPVHNGVDKPKLGDNLVDGTSGAVKRRGLISKRGHALIFFDDPSKDGAALMTGDKGMRISLNNTNTTIKVTSSGKIVIEGQGDVEVRSSADLTIEAQGNLTLKGNAVDMEANSTMDLKASATMTVKGSQIMLN